MRARRIGGLEVSVLGLGGMPMSLAGRPSEAQSIAVIHAALDGGITLIDTADVYCIDDSDLGHNEHLIAKALASWRGDRSKILVATKGGLRRPRGAWTSDARPERLREACEASLRALGIDRIGLYQLHAPDPDVPFTESVGALARLREEGKIERVGLSNVSAAQLAEARRIVPIASVQNRCHVRERRSFENGVLSACERDGVLFLAYSPVGGGRDRTRIQTDPALTKIAKARGASAEEIAIAWCFAKSPVIVPIPGASKSSSVASILRAARIELDASELASIG